MIYLLADILCGPIDGSTNRKLLSWLQSIRCASQLCIVRHSKNSECCQHVLPATVC